MMRGWKGVAGKARRSLLGSAVLGGSLLGGFMQNSSVTVATASSGSRYEKMTIKWWEAFENEDFIRRQGGGSHQGSCELIHKWQSPTGKKRNLTLGACGGGHKREPGKENDERG
eukprot:1155438-Pelagomonas_calceolata.AAC.5